MGPVQRRALPLPTLQQGAHSCTPLSPPPQSGDPAKQPELTLFCAQQSAPADADEAPGLRGSPRMLLVAANSSCLATPLLHPHLAPPFMKEQPV